MSQEMGAILVFGGIAVFAVIMLIIERRAIARRIKERGGREVDVGDLILFGSEAGEGEKTHK